MPASTVTAQRNRLAASALMAMRDRLNSALLDTSVLPTSEAAIVTVPTTTPTVDLAAFLAQGQALLATLQPAAAVAAPAPAPAVSGLAKAQAFWQTDYAGKGVPVRQLASGTWVDVKGAFCKGPKAAPKTQRAAAVARVAQVSGVPAGPGISVAQLERLLAALGGAAAVAAPVEERYHTLACQAQWASGVCVCKGAAPAPAATAATASVKARLVADGEGWLHCPTAGCTAYWSANRDEAFLAAKVAKHNRKHAG